MSSVLRAERGEGAGRVGVGGRLRYADGTPRAGLGEGTTTGACRFGVKRRGGHRAPGDAQRGSFPGPTPR